MTQVHGVANVTERCAAPKRKSAITAGSLATMTLLAAALSLTAITASSAQSYDPDIGSGNIVRAPGAGRYYGRINPAWRASIYRHHRRARHHRAR
jgi:hypothetical protein